MFEVGALYEFRTIEGGDEVVFRGVVEKYEHPLLKLEDTGPVVVRTMDENGMVVSEAGDETVYPGEIINVTSPNFVSAQKQKG